MGIIMFDIETTGLDPFQHQVILIGIKKDNTIKQLKLWEFNDETNLILEAINELKKIDKFRDTIIGYNNLKFDVPFMLKRLDLLGIMEPEYWSTVQNKKWFDLYQFMGDDFRALDSWIKKFKIEKTCPELDGKQMPECFRRKEYSKIEDHNIDDLNTSEKLFYRLKEEFPHLLKF